MKEFINSLGKKVLFVFIVLLLLIFIQVYFDIKILSFTSVLVNNLKNGESVLDISKKIILYLVISLICSINILYISSYISSFMIFKLRKIIYKKILNQNLLIKNNSLITRCVNDTIQLRITLFLFFRLFLYSVIAIINCLYKLYFLDKIILHITLSSILILLILILLLFKVISNRFKIIQNTTDKINNVVSKTINSIKKSKETLEKESFEVLNRTIGNNSLFVNRLIGIFNPIFVFLFNIVIVLIYLLTQNILSLSIALLLEVVMYISFIFNLLILLLVFILTLPRTFISLGRIFEVIKVKEEKLQNEFEFSKNLEIEFKNVSFKYEDSLEFVLKNLNFKIDFNKTVAIIGPTGCGKSTIINLILNLYKPTSGEILINNTSINNIPKSTLWQMIGYNPSEVILFDGTIKDNLLINDFITKDDLDKALKITELKKSLDYEVNNGLSVGETQLIQIARSICVNPKIYIFDDSSTSLDKISEQTIKNNILKYLDNTTKIFITQKVSNEELFDEIIVLDKGCIVGIGNSNYLSKTCNLYNDLRKSSYEEI